MGVTGLLQHLKAVQEPASLAQFKGQTLAVDTYGWLHRGLISCAQDLCTDVPTRGYITSVIKKVEMLRHFGVTPLMVFDGSPLPTKEGTHQERRLKREKAREQAGLCVQKGDRKGAWKEYMKAAAVTPEMAKSVMVELARMGVKYVVAPYEADPQMVYLEKMGVVDGILSEDLDLLVFGCRRLITKLNDYGECVEICTDNLNRVPRMALHNFTPLQWRLVAILSGCDYTKGIPGVGLKTAFNLVLKIDNLAKIVMGFRAENKTVPEDFLDEALKADLAFQFQKVFDMTTREVTTLCEIPQDSGLDMLVVELCCGRRLDPQIHAGICTGRLHPMTHTPLISREQNLSVMARSNSVNSRPVDASKAPAPSQKSQSFSHSKSIDSYFKSDKTAISKIAATPTLAPNMALKRPAEKATQLSPTTRKLRRFGVATTTTTTSVTHSKFFAAPAPQSLPVAILLPCPPPNDADLGFCTGDSEVPEDSSSPVKMDAGCVTDDDQDTELTLGESESNLMANSATSGRLQISASTQVESEGEIDDDGYENELEESPIKKARVGLSWRNRFAMGAANEPSKSENTKVTHKKTTVKVSVTAPETKGEIEETSFYESPESSLGPHTPEEIPEKAVFGDESSQPKSLQQTFVSEIDEEFDFSPERPIQPVAPKRSISKLLRFAFSG